MRLKPEEYLKLCQVDGSEGAAQHQATILNVLELRYLSVYPICFSAVPCSPKHNRTTRCATKLLVMLPKSNSYTVGHKNDTEFHIVLYGYPQKTRKIILLLPKPSPYIYLYERQHVHLHTLILFRSCAYSCLNSSQISAHPWNLESSYTCQTTIWSFVSHHIPNCGVPYLKLSAHIFT